jgi:transcriptional regulator with XRE-family HTH domain
MNQIIGEKIRKIRNVKGYNQEYMAQRLSISQRAYSKLERGEIKIDWDRINDIAEVLEVDPITLVNGEDVITFNNCHQSGKQNTINNYFSDEMKKTYDILIAEKDKIIKMLEEKIGNNNIP